MKRFFDKKDCRGALLSKTEAKGGESLANNSIPFSICQKNRGNKKNL